MDGYGQYCPIALGAEVFAERWTPIVLRNLMVGCTRFGEILDGAPGMPRSVLSQRLRSLERDGVVERRQFAHVPTYHLTECGAELAEVCIALGMWGARWREVRPEHHDPYLGLWTLSRLITPDSLPRPRVVVRFEFTDRTSPKRYWLVLGVGGNEVCAHDPGHPEDGVVTTDAAWLTRWVSGRAGIGRAQRAGGMDVVAPGWLESALDAWGRLSAFADVEPVSRRASPPPRRNRSA